MNRFDHGPRTYIIVRDHEDNYYCTEGLRTHGEIHLVAGPVGMEASENDNPEDALQAFCSAFTI